MFSHREPGVDCRSIGLFSGRTVRGTTTARANAVVIGWRDVLVTTAQKAFVLSDDRQEGTVLVLVIVIDETCDTRNTIADYEHDYEHEHEWRAEPISAKPRNSWLPRVYYTCKSLRESPGPDR